MPQDRDDRDDDPIANFLDAVGGGLGDAWRRGTNQLAGEESVESVREALDAGVEEGMKWSERRRAIRSRAERDLNREEPLVDVTEIENEDRELVGIRVLISDPDVDLYTGPEAVIARTDRHDTEVSVPFDDYEIEEGDAGGITEFTVRRVPPETKGSTKMPEDLDGFVEDIDELMDADALAHPDSELADNEWSDPDEDGVDDAAEPLGDPIVTEDLVEDDVDEEAAAEEGAVDPVDVPDESDDEDLEEE